MTGARRGKLTPTRWWQRLMFWRPKVWWSGEITYLNPPPPPMWYFDPRAWQDGEWEWDEERCPGEVVTRH